MSLSVSFHLLFYLCLSVVVYPCWDRSDMFLFSPTLRIWWPARRPASSADPVQSRPWKAWGSFKLPHRPGWQATLPFVWSESKTIAVVSAALQSSRTHAYFTGEKKIDWRRKGSWGQRRSWGKRRDRQESTTERQQKVTRETNEQLNLSV